MNIDRLALHAGMILARLPYVELACHVQTASAYSSHEPPEHPHLGQSMQGRPGASQPPTLH